MTAPAAPCTDVSIPEGKVFLGALANGTVGWVRPSKTDAPKITPVTGAYQALITDNIIQVSGNGIVTLPVIAAADLCANRRITVKRLSNNPLEVVRVTAAAGIDGAPGNNIGLGTSSKFGTLTGEAATFYFDGATWRIESSY